MAKKKIKRPQQYKKPQDPTFKEMWEALSDKNKQIIKIAAIAVVAVILLIIIWYNAIYDDGSLKVKNNAIVGAEENWLVAELDGGKNSDYYHIANLDAPAGYTAVDNGLGGSSLRTEFSYENADGISIYVSAVGKDVDAMIDSVYATFTNMTADNGMVTDVVSEEIAQGTARYFTYQYAYPIGEAADENTPAPMEYSQALVYYVPVAERDCCVLVSVSDTYDAADKYVDDSVLYAVAQDFVKGITSVEK